MNSRAWRLTKADAALFALVGVVLSLGIAAGLIWRTPHIKWSQYPQLVVDWESWPESDEFVDTPVGMKHLLWWGVDERWPWGDQFPDQIQAVNGVWAGLPFPCIKRRVDSPSEPGINMHSSFEEAFTLHDNLVLYRPAWPGLLADTLFWGGLLYLIRGSFRSLRARRRRRLGRCPACAYDQAGLMPDAPCPECATAHEKNRR